jgi:hypothetical protein
MQTGPTIKFATKPRGDYLMEQSDLLRHVCTVLENQNLPYLITGSQATIAFGEPRFTNDIDIVVSLGLNQLDAFLKSFPAEEFYLSRDAARDAIARHSMFNIIHPSSGLKVDVIIPGSSEFERNRFERGRKVRVAPDFTATFASPEDVILKKLQFFKIGGSDKHLRDIAGVLKVSGAMIDRDYIDLNAEQFGVADIWQRVLNDLEKHV